MLVMDVDLADNSLLLFAAVVTVDLSRTYMCIYRVCNTKTTHLRYLHVLLYTYSSLSLSLSPSIYLLL